MSAVNCRTGLLERLRTISGLTVLAAEPATVQVTPLAWVSLISGTFLRVGQVNVRTWRFQIRVCVPFHDNILADDQIIPYADSVTNAIRADPTLGGRANISHDMDISAEGDDGMYITGSGETVTMFRSMVFRMDIRDKL